MTPTATITGLSFGWNTIHVWAANSRNEPISAVVSKKLVRDSGTGCVQWKGKEVIASQDTFTGGSGANNGTSTQLEVATHHAHERRILVQFDLTDFGGGTVSNASVSLYQIGVWDTSGWFNDGDNIVVNRIWNSKWNVPCPWNEINGGLGADCLFPYDTTTIWIPGVSQLPPGGTYHTWNLLPAFLQGWFDSAYTNNGMHFWGNPHNSGTGMAFASREHPNGKGPRLKFDITCSYTPPTSCEDVLDSGAYTGEGLYLIDPDGNGGADPIEEYCDMAPDDGDM